MDPLEYHKHPIPGKTEIIPTKKCITQNDLSLAYSPGVAEPCLAIKENPISVEMYTNRANLVAVITNGSAVLGLGNIGALASKPVMEGKAVLFKRFADIDVFDIEINANDPEKIIETISLLEPTFGGINLEDIKAPECFYIEETLKEKLKIPVFHDDQHGTAIISGAALINALELTNKNIEDIKVVVNGAGAAGISCSQFYITLGVKKENIILCDSKGIIHEDRVDNINQYKKHFAIQTEKRTLTEALQNTDVFLGLSVQNILNKEMLLSMNPNPIIFALANPIPEIMPEIAKKIRDDIIIATGRSDYPNQVNNVLGFPFIFRGSLDMGAKEINDEMKIAATKALASLAKETVPEYINTVYNTTNLTFGKDYLIPKPFDVRVFYEVSHAVALAAHETGVATIKYPGKDAYIAQLKKRFDSSISRFI